MKIAVKNAKHFYWRWKQEDDDNREIQNYKNMRRHKKKLRTEQRRLNAAKRDKKYNRIMELSRKNDKHFFTLVNRQRNITSSSTSILTVDDKTSYT